MLNFSKNAKVFLRSNIMLMHIYFSKLRKQTGVTIQLLKVPLGGFRGMIELRNNLLLI